MSKDEIYCACGKFTSVCDSCENNYNMRDPLPKNIGTLFQSHKSKVCSLSKQLFKRTDYIIRTIHRLVETKHFDHWSFEMTGDNDPSLMSPDEFIDQGENIYFVFYPRPYKQVIFKDKDGNDFDILHYFPTRWLYESFEKELEEGIDKKKTVEDIKHKLTPEEYVILRNHIKKEKK